MKGLANEVKSMVARAAGALKAPVGIAWFSPEAWQRLEATPKARIEMSYADNLHNLESIELATVDIDQLITWCHRHGYEINSKGRAAYSAVLVMARGDPDWLNKPVIDKTRSVQ